MKKRWRDRERSRQKRERGREREGRLEKAGKMNRVSSCDRAGREMMSSCGCAVRAWREHVPVCAARAWKKHLP